MLINMEYINHSSMLQAQTNIGTEFGKNFTGGAPSSIGNVVSGALPQIYVIALVVVLIYLIWGAYRYMMSGGDAKAVAAARAHLTWSELGMIFIFLAFGIYQLVNSLLFGAFTKP